MKKFLLSALAGIIASLFNVYGATTTWNPTTAATNSLLSVGTAIYRITVANPSTAVATVTFQDAPSTNRTFVVAAYSNSVATLGNITNTFTNILGTVQTTIYTNVLTTSTTTVAQSTNNYRTVASLVVPAGTTSNFEPINPTFGFQGLLGVTTTNINVTVEYSTIY